MSRWLPALLILAVILAVTGCSQSTKSGEPTNTGVLTGYELNNQQDFEESRRDRVGYRDFD